MWRRKNAKLMRLQNQTFVQALSTLIQDYFYLVLQVRDIPITNMSIPTPGVGKSTLGNLLLGVNKGKCKRRKSGDCTERDNFKLENLMSTDEELPFEPGSGIDSKTVHTKIFSGQYLGNGPCITFIDTPGKPK